MENDNLSIQKDLFEIAIQITVGMSLGLLTYLSASRRLARKVPETVFSTSTLP
jgi:hypothetical protein